MWANRLSKDQRDAVLDAYSKGVPVEKIAAEFGVHHTYPSLLARRRGLNTRMSKKNVRYPTKENNNASA